MGRREYRFVELVGTESTAEFNRIYWREILYRAHFSASAGLLRLRLWLEGVADGAVSGNPLSVAASLRGFLEATADTWETFRAVPSTIAEGHVSIRRALSGELNEPFLAEQLEESLIHFMYARGLQEGELAPASHDAKPTAHYIESIAEAVPTGKNVYGILCQYTHPASQSLSFFSRRRLADDPSCLVLDSSGTLAQLAVMMRLSERLGRKALWIGIIPA